MNSLKELYLTVFVLFYRFAKNSWSRELNGWKAAAGVTLLQWCVAGSLLLWAVDLGGYGNVTGITRSTMFLIWFATYFLNYHALVVRGSGIRFETAFEALEPRKRIILRVAGTGLIIVGFGFAFLSACALAPH